MPRGDSKQRLAMERSDNEEIIAFLILTLCIEHHGREEGSVKSTHQAKMMILMTGWIGTASRYQSASLVLALIIVLYAVVST